MAAAPRALVLCLDGLTETVRRLQHDFDVRIEWQPLPDDLGFWEPSSRTMYVNIDAPLSDQTWLLIDLWKLLNIGPQYAPDAELVPPKPSLRLVAGS